MPRPTTHYRSFNNYLREYFGARVYRVPLDAGFTCPNRDGQRAFGGCTFCDERGSGAPTIKTELSVRKQLLEGIDRIKHRFKAQKFMAYFQAFSNTYAPEATLKNLYDLSLDHPDVVGLCIGTRPDCVPDNVLDLLAEYAQKTYVLLELGVQTVHNRTLEDINRGHSAEEFFDAVERAKARGLMVATHLIFGFAGETRADMMETVRQIANSKVDALKIHQLCVFSGAPMEAQWRAGEIPMLGEDEYIDMVCDAVEMLPPEMIIMRLMAEGTKGELLAPEWGFDKERIMNKIEDEFDRRGTRQGSKFAPAVAALT